tara:strand:- start:1008 stop:1694 length:687 start_codon:yes stop_codon:yes gene_type:complete
MEHNFYNLKSGVKNDPNDNPLFKSFIDPRLILKQFGKLSIISKNLFNLDIDKNDDFIIHFFDYSVRLYAFVLAHCHELGKTGDNLNKVAAEGFFKSAKNIRTLGIHIVEKNKDIFKQESNALIEKYYLERNLNYDTTKSLDNLSYIYDSWYNICTLLIYKPKSLPNEYKEAFRQDIEIAVEAGAPPIIWYLSGEISNNGYKWQDFVDKNLRKYWDKIPNDKKFIYKKS